MDRHPIGRLFRRGVTVRTDGRTSSDTSVSAELEPLRDQFGWGRAEMLACQHNAAPAVFAPPAVRDALIARIEAEMSRTEPVA
jgi:adenosine deaminase